MDISSIVIETHPEMVGYVKKWLADIPEVEVHQVVNGCKIIATVEASNIDGAVEIGKHIHNIPGVITMQVAYHHYEEEVVDA